MMVKMKRHRQRRSKQRQQQRQSNNHNSNHGSLLSGSSSRVSLATIIITTTMSAAAASFDASSSSSLQYQPSATALPLHMNDNNNQTSSPLPSPTNPRIISQHNQFLIPPQERLKQHLIVSNDDNSFHLRIGGNNPRGGGRNDDDMEETRKFYFPRIEINFDRHPFLSFSSSSTKPIKASKKASSIPPLRKNIKSEQSRLLKNYPLTTNEYISYYPPINLPPPQQKPQLSSQSSSSFSNLSSSTKTKTPSDGQKRINQNTSSSHSPNLHDSSTSITPFYLLEKEEEENDEHAIAQEGGGSGFSMTISNPSSASNLILVLGKDLGGAIFGTLTLLGPLIVSRKILHHIGLALTETIFKQYVRRTYTRLERVYLRYYEAPATFRASCRITSQVGLLWTLNEVLDIIVLAWNKLLTALGETGAGIFHNHKRGGSNGSMGFGWSQLCHVFLMVTIGRIFAESVSSWSGPLRIQAAQQPKRSSPKAFHDKPVHAWEWTKEGGATWWYKVAANPESSKFFDPNPLAFPITWFPPTLVLMCALARALSTGSALASSTTIRLPDSTTTIASNKSLMRRFIVQLALGDEWQRVFLGERRVGLGIFIVFGYLSALIGTIKTTMTIDRVAAALMVPSLLCVFVSGWMNVVIFWNRMGTKQKEAVANLVRPYQK